MLGMNTNRYFDPSMRLLSALKETQQMGLSRIEISYYADSEEAERLLLEDSFAETMHNDLDQVQAALNSIDGLCYHLPQINILKEFNELCKPHQLFVQLPHVCAMVYSQNSKKGYFTGFFQDIAKTG